MHRLPTPRPHRQGFSLVELLAVMAILVIMLALLAPAISTITGSTSRNGAVNILMNTMEQARVAALESGRTVYLVFNRQTFPDPDRIMVLREPDPESGKTDYEQLTSWIKLPKGILLHSAGKTDILSESLPTGTSGTNLVFDPAKSKAFSAAKGDLNILAFNAYGGVVYPNSTKLMLIVCEGVRDSNGAEALISPNKNAGGFEIITLRRYTGRASLEVTTL
ncbi:MAG TPA: prepilin-type N-terminal cleavage/methylation domain-containing protein [Chthoniobacterales bacterium]